MEVPSIGIRVQPLVQDGKSVVVPPQYVQPQDNRPLRSVENVDNCNLPSLPIIDLSNRDSLHEQLEQVCREWGVFHVINHGVPIELLNGMRQGGRFLFEDCTMDQKLCYSCDPNSPASEGYGSKMLVTDNDTVLDWRDYFNHHTLPLSRRNPSKWPDFSPNYRKVVAEYSDQMSSLAEKLLGLISESLGLSSSCLKDVVGEFDQNITTSYYPPCPQPELTLGLQAHSDFGAITLLIQDDVGGLEVLKDVEWTLVKPLRDAILVILSDQIEIITNGRYKSAVHRAITNSKAARLSVATFHDPAKTKTISPIFDPPRYRPSKYSDYIKSWYTRGPKGKRNIDDLLFQ